MSNNDNNDSNNKDKKYIRKSSFKTNDKDYFKKKLNKMHRLSFNLNTHFTYFTNNNNDSNKNNNNDNNDNNNDNNDNNDNNKKEINEYENKRKRFVKMKTYTKPFSNYIALTDEDKIKKINEINKESSKRLIKYRNIFEKIKNEIKGIDETFNLNSTNNDDNNNHVYDLKKSCNTIIHHKKSNLKNNKIKYKHQKSISYFSQRFEMDNNNKIDFENLNIPKLNLNEIFIKKKSNKKISFKNDLLDSKNCDANLDLSALNEGKKTIRIKDNKNELISKINFRSNILNNSNRFNSIDTNASNNVFNNDGKYLNRNNKKYVINYDNINTQEAILETENNNVNCCKTCECNFQ